LGPRPYSHLSGMFRLSEHPLPVLLDWNGSALANLDCVSRSGYIRRLPVCSAGRFQVKGSYNGNQEGPTKLDQLRARALLEYRGVGLEIPTLVPDPAGRRAPNARGARVGQPPRCRASDSLETDRRESPQEWTALARGGRVLRGSPRDRSHP